MFPVVKAKNEVKFNGSHFYYEVARIIQMARDTAPEFSDGTMWITSANDGTHMEGSKHYTNEAFDIRIWNIVGGHAVTRTWTVKMQRALGNNYDVVLEEDHIHAEYDPK